MRRIRDTPRALDLLLVGAVGVLGVLQAFTSPMAAGDRPGQAVLALCLAAPLFWRRAHPLAVAALLFAIFGVAVGVLGLSDPPAYGFLAFIAVCYAPAAYSDGRAAVAGLVLCLAGVFVSNVLQGDSDVGTYVFTGFVALAAWLAGRTVRSRSRLAAELHEGAVLAEEEREEAARRAVADERRRIAREMHDVVAHSVSVMVVQAGGARRILAREPQRAIAAAAQIESTGREALVEMRRLLGVLRAEDADAELGPQPTLAALGDLVGRARSAGLPVTLVVEGERRPLPQGVDLAAYRVVQEALTNAIKHAGAAPTSVHVRWGEDALALDVTDRGPGPAVTARANGNGGGGHGLVGMEERVRLYGGRLDTGRAEGGGFAVHATLPFGEDDAG